MIKQRNEGLFRRSLSLLAILLVTLFSVQCNNALLEEASNSGRNSVADAATEAKPMWNGQELISIPVDVSTNISTFMGLAGVPKSGEVFDFVVEVFNCGKYDAVGDSYQAEFVIKDDSQLDDSNSGAGDGSTSDTDNNTIKVPKGMEGCLVKLNSFRILMPGESELAEFKVGAYHRKKLISMPVGKQFSDKAASPTITRTVKASDCDWKTDGGYVLEEIGLQKIFDKDNVDGNSSADMRTTTAPSQCKYDFKAEFNRKGTSGSASKDKLLVSISSQLGSELADGTGTTIDVGVVGEDDSIQFNVMSMANAGSASSATGVSGSAIGNSSVSLAPPPFSLSDIKSSITNTVNGQAFLSVQIDFECNSTMIDSSVTASSKVHKGTRCEHFISGAGQKGLYPSRPNLVDLDGSANVSDYPEEDSLKYYIIDKSLFPLGINISAIDDVLTHADVLFDDDTAQASSTLLGTSVAHNNSSAIANKATYAAGTASLRFKETWGATAAEKLAADTDDEGNYAKAKQGYIAPNGKHNEVRTKNNRGGFRIVWHTINLAPTGVTELNKILLLEMEDGDNAGVKSYLSLDLNLSANTSLAN